MLAQIESVLKPRLAFLAEACGVWPPFYTKLPE